MKLKPLMVAAALATTLGAHAATPVTLTNTTGNTWTGSISDTPLLGGFTDVFTFSKPATAGSTVQLEFSNLSTSGLPSDPLSIMFTSATLNATPLYQFSFASPAGFSQGYYLPVTALSTGGLLTLTVTGTSYGGSYAGNINLTVKPVPEPATYGMLLGGLGLLALVRRKGRS
ncbi:FxDxF family PEP-CTERM protein [Rugamonas sp.]|uniref:FxDxF family PEP-CTERM protein n=1 Tax=Rugamonas sp. TaxID=1926287 RepID=UPI0025D0E08C|nr:FxDxF family PEP-CTERM protein [Rugamonas sp.]